MRIAADHPLLTRSLPQPSREAKRAQPVQAEAARAAAAEKGGDEEAQKAAAKAAYEAADDRTPEEKAAAVGLEPPHSG